MTAIRLRTAVRVASVTAIRLRMAVRGGGCLGVGDPDIVHCYMEWFSV